MSIAAATMTARSRTIAPISIIHPYDVFLLWGMKSVILPSVTNLYTCQTCKRCCGLPPIQGPARSTQLAGWTHPLVLYTSTMSHLGKIHQVMPILRLSFFRKGRAKRIKCEENSVFAASMCLYQWRRTSVKRARSRDKSVANTYCEPKGWVTFIYSQK